MGYERYGSYKNRAMSSISWVCHYIFDVIFISVALLWTLACSNVHTTMATWQSLGCFCCGKHNKSLMETDVMCYVTMKTSFCNGNLIHSGLGPTQKATRALRVRGIAKTRERTLIVIIALPFSRFAKFQTNTKTKILNPAMTSISCINICVIIEEGSFWCSNVNDICKPL